MSKRHLAWLLPVCLAGCPDHAQKHEHTQGAETTHDERDHGDQPSGHTKGRVVVLSAEAIRRSGIKIATATQTRLAGGIDVPAEITLNPDRTAHITPLVSGRIDQVTVALGSRVKKGQTLARLRSVALGETRAMVAQAKAAVAVARANFTRQQELAKEGIGSRRKFLEAEGELKRAAADLTSAQQRLSVYGGRGGAGSVTTIRSPLAGVIIQRHATPGEVITANRPIFVVADLSRVWVVGRLYEQDVAAAKVGALATLVLQAYPKRMWRGTVSYVADTLDAQSRTLAVRVELDNPDRVLRPGLYGTLSLSRASAAGAAAITVPEGAVQRIEGEAVVFVPGDKPGHFRSVGVVPGKRIRGQVVIEQGLKAGSRIVSAGAFVLKSELLRADLADDHAH